MTASAMSSFCVLTFVFTLEIFLFLLNQRLNLKIKDLTCVAPKYFPVIINEEIRIIVADYPGN